MGRGPGSCPRGTEPSGAGARGTAERVAPGRGPRPRRSAWRAAAGEVGKGGEGEPACSPPLLAALRARPGSDRGRPTGGWHCPPALGMGSAVVPTHVPGAAPHLTPGRATAGGQPRACPPPRGEPPPPTPVPCTRRRRGRGPRGDGPESLTVLLWRCGHVQYSAWQYQLSTKTPLPTPLTPQPARRSQDHVPSWSDMHAYL